MAKKICHPSGWPHLILIMTAFLWKQGKTYIPTSKKGNKNGINLLTCKKTFLMYGIFEKENMNLSKLST